MSGGTSLQELPDQSRTPPGAGATPLRETALRVAVWTCIVLLSAGHVFRGLDVTDTGFLLTNQRLIFSAPESVSYWFHLWLTNVAGGVVDLVFGRYGILPHKIAGAVILLVTLLVAAVLLYRGKMARNVILLGIAAGAGFHLAGKIFVVHYNNLSALLFVVGAGFMARGVLRKERTPFFVSGLALGLNCLVRLPNLAGLGLIVIPFLVPLFSRSNEERSGVGILQVLIYLSGAGIAAGCALIAMVILGHFDLYLRSLQTLANSAAVDAGSYGMGVVILRVAKNIAFCLLLGPSMLLGTAAISAFLSLLRRRSIQVTLTGLGLVVSSVLLVGPLIAIVKYTQVLRTIVGLCYWLIFVGLFDSEADRGIRLTGALAVGISLALSVGSDTAVIVSAYAIPFMLPAALDAAARLARLSGRVSVPALQRLGRRISPVLPMVTAAAVAAFSLYGGVRMVYRDTAFPTTTVDHRELHGVYTSTFRAAALEEGLALIGGLVPEGGTLFAFDSLALVHFATRTLPYLSNPWPALYREDYLDQLLRQRELEGELPVVALARSNPRSSGWPANTARPVHLRPVEAFLARNRYSERWSNAGFTILLPENSSR